MFFEGKTRKEKNMFDKLIERDQLSTYKKELF